MKLVPFFVTVYYRLVHWIVCILCNWLDFGFGFMVGGGGGGGGVLPDMSYIGMCHCEGYGFQAVLSEIGLN